MDMTTTNTPTTQIVQAGAIVLHTLHGAKRARQFHVVKVVDGKAWLHYTSPSARGGIQSARTAVAPVERLRIVEASPVDALGRLFAERAAAAATVA